MEAYTYVSIHTPTKGVTVTPRVYLWLMEFQSTHPRRVWHPVERSSHVLSCFNPHTHEGCDNASRRGYILYNVSIHTPTKGVTSGRRHNNGRSEKFQSTHPRRVWLFDFFFNNSIAMFQSTHPRRVWQCLANDFLDSYKFQSTHPRRVWREKDEVNDCPVSFNPHTHEGCDLESFCWKIPLNCFNPHTHEGCDSDNFLSKSSIKVSIHTPTKGVTIILLLISVNVGFQSTHPRRVWHLSL